MQISVILLLHKLPFCIVNNIDILLVKQAWLKAIVTVNIVRLFQPPQVNFQTWRKASYCKTGLVFNILFVFICFEFLHNYPSCTQIVTKCQQICHILTIKNVDSFSWFLKTKMTTKTSLRLTHFVSVVTCFLKFFHQEYNFVIV